MMGRGRDGESVSEGDREGGRVKEGGWMRG